jgi:hypothetical protein
MRPEVEYMLIDDYEIRQAKSESWSTSNMLVALSRSRRKRGLQKLPVPNGAADWAYGPVVTGELMVGLFGLTWIGTDSGPDRYWYVAQLFFLFNFFFSNIFDCFKINNKLYILI